MSDDPVDPSESSGNDDEEGLPTNCPADQLLRLLWGEWTTHILWVLGEAGPQRFVRLRDLIEGVSPKVLTTRLRQMEERGLIWRDYEREVPPKVTYGLTDMGRELHAALRTIEPLAEKWFGNQPTA